MHKIAKKMNGKCLSEKYVNNNTKLSWLCSNGHIFEKDYSHIKRGSWCPDCNSGVGENKCRYIFEKIFEKDFPNTKKALIGRYELDGFNKELNLAFEYQGEQHYRFIKTWHKTKEKFEKIKYIDNLKLKICNQDNIKLIVIPYFEYDKGDENLFNFIKETLLIYGYKIKLNFEELEMENKNFYSNELEELKKIAQNKGGKLLSNIYNGVFVKYEWECVKNHKWFATADSIKNAKSWCRVCSLENIKEKTKLRFKNIVEEKDATVNFENYISAKDKIEIKCHNDHFFKIKPSSVFNGEWCPKCGRESAASKLRLNKEHLTNFANENSIILKTEFYINSKQKLNWECKNNHKFSACIDIMKKRTKKGPVCLECKKQKN